MKFSHNWLKEIYPKIKSPEVAAKLLTFHAFQVEGVKKIGNDVQFDIDVLANRAADSSGHWGIARELAVIDGGMLLFPKIKLKENAKTTASSMLSVKIEKGTPVARYSARVVTGVKVGTSPKWMQERLTTCGLRPINVVVDITNYVMLEIGQPLHAFDYDRLFGSTKKEIIVRRAKKSEILETLGDDSQKLHLAENDIVISDPKGPIGLGGIKGGRGSEILEGTTQIVLEAANFDPAAIRTTSRRFSLRTDASWRFEHNIDPNLTSLALDYAAELIQKYAGGIIARGLVDVYPEKEPIKVIPFSPSRVRLLLGVIVPEATATSILKRLECIVKKKKADLYQVIPPSFRRDLNIEEDLIEEVGRIRGYENIPSQLPLVRGGATKKTDRQDFEDSLKMRIAGFGFSETHLSSFVGDKELSIFGLDSKTHYHLENPINPETSLLVQIAALQYIRSAAENLYNLDKVKIFGIARSFVKTEKGPQERRSLIMVLSERGKDGKEEFFRMKGAVEALMESFGIADHSYDESARERHNWAHPNRVAGIKAGETTIGVIGEVSSANIGRLKAKGRIVIAEFDIEKLHSVIEAEEEFRPIGKFPAIIRDIAFVIPESARIQDVENTLHIAGGDLLIDSDMFDYYEGKGLSAGKKSVAFHLIFQSKERTLTDAEVNLEFEKIAKAVISKGWEVRG